MEFPDYSNNIESFLQDMNGWMAWLSHYDEASEEVQEVMQEQGEHLMSDLTFLIHLLEGRNN